VPRPLKQVDTEKLKQLAAIGLSSAEMAAVLDCSIDTLERRYRKAMETGRQMRNASLKRKQYEKAMSGNATMLIWLGKQYLGQRDKMEHSGEIDSKVSHVIVDL
jgi:sulfur transfer protein SufE